MKRYDPSLYEERFGEDSDWYKDHKDEQEVDKMMNDLLKERKDEQEGYIEVKKSKDEEVSSFGKKSTESKSTFGVRKNKKW